MAYQIFRVEVTRDETRADGPVGIEITAYIDRMPETNEATLGRLSRAWRGVWNSRLQCTGDFRRQRIPGRGGTARAVRRELAAQRLASAAHRRGC